MVIINPAARPIEISLTIIMTPVAVPISWLSGISIFGTRMTASTMVNNIRIGKRTYRAPKNGEAIKNAPILSAATICNTRYSIIILMSMPGSPDAFSTSKPCMCNA